MIHNLQICHGNTEGQRFGNEAFEFLKSTIAGRMVTIVVQEKDQYGRILASVYVANFLGSKIDVACELLKAGLAVIYRGKGAKYNGQKDAYMAAEKLAKYEESVQSYAFRDNRIGLWSLAEDQFCSPRDFKRRNRK